MVCCINLHFTVQFIAVVLILLHLLGTIASFYADFSPVSLSLSLVINQDGIKGFFQMASNVLHHSIAVYAAVAQSLHAIINLSVTVLRW